MTKKLLGRVSEPKNQENKKKGGKENKMDKNLRKHVTTLCTYIFMINVALAVSRVHLVFLPSSPLTPRFLFISFLALTPQNLSRHEP